jgi:hypothetical protein
MCFPNVSSASLALWVGSSRTSVRLPLHVGKTERRWAVWNTRTHFSQIRVVVGDDAMQEAAVVRATTKLGWLTSTTLERLFGTDLLYRLIVT